MREDSVTVANLIMKEKKTTGIIPFQEIDMTKNKQGKENHGLHTTKIEKKDGNNDPTKRKNPKNLAATSTTTMIVAMIAILRPEEDTMVMINTITTNAMTKKYVGTIEMIEPSGGDDDDEEEERKTINEETIGILEEGEEVIALRRILQEIRK